MFVPFSFIETKIEGLFVVVPYFHSHLLFILFKTKIEVCYISKVFSSVKILCCYCFCV